jgi:hypothetical protein
MIAAGARVATVKITLREANTSRAREYAMPAENEYMQPKEDKRSAGQAANS